MIDMIDMIERLSHCVICFLGESHRGAHLIVGLFGGLFFTALFTIGFAFGMELKEVQADRENTGRPWWKPWGLCWRKWDWIDVGMTVGGGVVGNAVWILALINV